MLKHFYFFAPNTHCALVVALSEKTSTIEYGYRKCGTNSPVFSQTLAHGNSKSKRTQREGKKRGVSMVRSKEVPKANHFIIKIQ